MKSKTKKKVYGLIAMFVVMMIVATANLTYAWFTDQKNFSGTLNFGEISIIVDDNTTEDMSSQTSCLAVYRDFDGDGTYENLSKNQDGKYQIMPGDKVGVNVRVSLSSTSEDVFYLVSLFSDSETLGSIFNHDYFVKDDEIYYVKDDNSELKVYNYSSNLIVEDFDYVGSLEQTAGKNVHLMQVLSEINRNLTEDDIVDVLNNEIQITCSIRAIQKANIDSQTKAYYLITNKSDSAVNQTYTFPIVYDPNDMNYEGRKSLGMQDFRNTGIVYSLTGFTGRSVSTTALQVEGGSKIKLVQNIQGVNIAYLFMEFTSKTFTVGTLSENCFDCSYWATEELTLQSTTKYLLIAFKKNDGTVDFTQEELAQLKNCIEIVKA
ncbi:MAG: hypothetical protein ACI4TI_01150 [Christensenellales bacterium]